MSDLYLGFDSVFFEKTRLSILTILFKETTSTYNSLKLGLALSDGALYSHLEKLKEAGYIERAKEIINDSVASRYSMTEVGRKEFQKYLKTLELIIANSKGEKA